MGKLVCTALIIGAFVLGIYVGRMPIMSLVLDDTPAQVSTTSNTEEKSSAPMKTEAEGGTVIKTTSLSPGQQKLLSTLGIDASQIVITPAMVACAEAKVGAARLKEIEGGATPSFSEGVSLLACYK